MIAVVAFDLSLNATGIAQADGQLSTYKPASKKDHRLSDIANELEMAVYADHPAFVVLEDLPIGIRNAAAGSLGMLHGAIRLVLLRTRTPYLTVPPATLKTYATGRGNAPKPDMRMALYKRTGQDVPDDNQVDAAWLRLLALDLVGEPELDLPQTHRRALTKLTLPAMEPAA